PRPRNRVLADAMKRIGIVERSGRGVDTIYRGLLKFGRPAPDYTRTDGNNVVVQTDGAELCSAAWPNPACRGDGFVPPERGPDQGAAQEAEGAGCAAATR